MTPRSNDLYLNSLCLAAWAPGAASLNIVKAVIGMFDNDLTMDQRAAMAPTKLMYVKLLREIAGGSLNLANRAEAAEVLLKYQDDEIFKSNKLSFDELQSMLMPTELPSVTKVSQLFNKVKNNIIWYKTNARIRKMNVTSARMSSEDDLEKQANLMKELLADLDKAKTDIETDPSGIDDNSLPIEEIDMDDKMSVIKALHQQKKKRDGTAIRFCWQGLNRMFGPSRAAAYGEVFCVAGLSHCGKSEVLMTMARSHCQYNQPPDTGGRQPVILFISLENEVSENLINMYKAMYRNTYHKDPIGLDDEEVSTYLMQGLGKNGFHLKIVRRLGDSFGYSDYVKMVEDIEKKHAKVVATYLDYVTLCRHCPEDKDKNDSQQIQLMIRRFKDFAQQREMFFATGLQLDAEASRIKLSGQTNVVKRYNESTLSDCKSSKKELDLLFFCDIETNHLGVPYLMLSWHKHKYVHDTAQEDKFCAYRFTPLGILDDVDGEPRFTRDIYAEDNEEQQGENDQGSPF